MSGICIDVEFYYASGNGCLSVNNRPRRLRLIVALARAAREALANKAVIHSLRSELFQMYVFSAG